MLVLFSVGCTTDSLTGAYHSHSTGVREGGERERERERERKRERERERERERKSSKLCG